MLTAAAYAQPYELEATVLEYEAGILNASGGVTGRFDTAEIRADELQETPKPETSIYKETFFSKMRI